MTLNFYLICFGILGCYAGLRTARHGWVKGLICIFLAGCIIHFAFDTFMKPERPPPKIHIAANEPLIRHQGVRGFFGDRLDDLETDRCVMRAMEVTPLSPIAHVVELRSFLAGYKQLQAQQLHGAQNLKSLSALASRSLGATSDILNPQETAAIAATHTDDLESLCNAFGKWTANVATLPPPEQQQIWINFLSTIRSPQ